MTVSQNESFFDFNSNRPFDSLLSLQIDPSAPKITGGKTATGMVLPDRTVLSRMRHLPDDLYDLRDSSHLMRFCQAMMGESGIGGMRKRNIVSQFQNAMQGVNFYDLDRFYGAIFGIYRFAAEVIRFDPYAETATQVEWDEVEGADAAFRERIFRLAAAINLGGTYPGIKSAAEAITLVDCEVFESWSAIDLYGSGQIGNTWGDIEALGTWGDIEASGEGDDPHWADLASLDFQGRSGANSRGEVVVWPKKDYAAIEERYGVEEMRRQRAQDQESLVRVLSVLRPANVLLTVDDSGIAPYESVPLTHLWSPQSLWEVAEVVTPGPDYDASVYPISPAQREAGVGANESREIPKPPWTLNDRADWTHNSDLVSAQSYAIYADADSPFGEGEVRERNVNYMVTRDDQSLNVFSARRGVLDGRRAHAARLGKEGAVVVHPYAGDRARAVTHG